MPTSRSLARSLRAAAVGGGALLALLAPGLALTAQAAPTHLTADAARAGLQPGNATMGWRHEGVTSGATRMSTAAISRPTGVLGIDVASYQGRVNWSRWAGAGKSFAFVKATEGTYYRNPYFTSQYTGAAGAGLLRGAYHFGIPNKTAGYRQARYFVANGGTWSALDGRTLPGVLDIEYNPYGGTCYGLSKTSMVSWITSFTTEYKRLTGKDAIIYTTTDWWTRCTGNTAKFTTTNPLWIARYGTSTPGTLPGAWRTATFWQYTSTPLDSDRFSGSYDRLKVLATVV